MSDPNLLCISIDSLRADECSALDSPAPTTPRLEALAERGTVCTRAISPSTWTFPVHTSAFTGLYPVEHGLDDEGKRLGAHPTLAERLSEAGYTTESYGHNGWIETGGVLRGFSHTHTPACGPTPDGAAGLPGRAWRKLRRETFRLGSEDAHTVKTVSDRLRSLSSPFCLFVHFQGAHYKYRPHVEQYRPFGDASLSRLRSVFEQQQRLYNDRLNKYCGQWAPEDSVVDDIRDMYRGCVRETDAQVAALLDALDASGHTDDTVVVVFGDHGDCFGEDGIYGHNFSLADALIRVPLIIVDPTGQLDIDTYGHLVQLNDLYPTLLELAGLEPAETLSQSLISEQPRETAFAHYLAPDSTVESMHESIASTDEVTTADVPPRRQLAAWRGPEEKLVYYPEEDEYTGPAADDEPLRERLAAHRESLSPVEPRGGAVDEATRANLVDMGYL